MATLLLANVPLVAEGYSAERNRISDSSDIIEAEPVSAEHLEYLQSVFCAEIEGCEEESAQLLNEKTAFPIQSRVVNGEEKEESFYPHVRQILYKKASDGTVWSCSGIFLQSAISVMGFGASVALGQYNSGSGKLRVGINHVQESGDWIVTFGHTCTIYDAYGACDYDGTYAIAGPGDSGGPVFSGTDYHQLVGVSSLLLPLNVGENDANANGFANMWAPFTREYLKSDLPLYGYPMALLPDGY